MKAKDLSSRLARWSLELAEYDFKIVYNSGRAHGDADYLSRNIRKCESLHIVQDKTHFPEDLIYELRPELEPVSEQILHEWSPSNTKAKQEEDRDIGTIIKKINGQLKTNGKEKRALQRQYVIKSGILFRITKQGHQEFERLYVPPSLIRSVLHVSHDIPTAGHFGFAKTLWRIKQYCYWPSMTLDILGYVKSCHECQFRKMPNHTPIGPQLKTTPLVDNVMKTVSIDLVGPLTHTNEDNRYVLTVTDQLSKFAIAVALYETKDVDIMEALERSVFYRYGPSSILLSDNGKNLCSNACERFYDSWGVTHVTTTPYHPCSNGQCEKFNGTLAVLLATQIKGDDERWDVFIDSVVLSYNMTVSASTGYSPFYLMFGRQADSPHMIRLGCQSAEKAQGTNIVEDRKRAIERMKKLQEKNMTYVNQKRTFLNYKTGDLVLLLSQPLLTQRSAKLHFRYLGPYMIKRKLSENVFEIQGKDGRKQIKIVNGMNLKRFHSRDDFKLQCEKDVQSIANVNKTSHKSSHRDSTLSLWHLSLNYLTIN